MTYPNDQITLSLLIDSVEYRGYLNLKDYPITIENPLTQQVDTAQFTLCNLPSKPEGLKDVVIYDGSTKIFAGVVTAPAGFHLNGIQAAYTIACSDYGILLKSVFVSAVYENKSDLYILQDQFSTVLPEITTADFVEEIATLELKRWNRVSLESIVNELCEDSGADWYVDYDKKLHYFSTEQLAAPFDLSDEPDLSTSFPFGNAQTREDYSGVVNRLHVVGGQYLSEVNDTFYIAGTGETDVVDLPFKLDAPSDDTQLQVWRNDGDDTTPSWTALTVLQGVEDELESANQVLLYTEEDKLEAYADWPLLNKAVMVRGRRYVPLSTTLESEASYNTYGRWLESKLIDESILSKADARMRGRKYLAENAYGKTSITCQTLKPGLRSGMHINFKDDVLDVDGRVLINNVSVTIRTGRHPIYRLSMGVYDPTLIDYIIDIKRQQQKLADPVREDEVLDYVLMEREGFGFSETHDVSQSQGPYKIGTMVIGFSRISAAT